MGIPLSPTIQDAVSSMIDPEQFTFASVEGSNNHQLERAAASHVRRPHGVDETLREKRQARRMLTNGRRDHSRIGTVWTVSDVPVTRRTLSWSVRGAR